MLFDQHRKLWERQSDIQRLSWCAFLIQHGVEPPSRIFLVAVFRDSNTAVFYLQFPNGSPPISHTMSASVSDYPGASVDPDRGLPPISPDLSSLSSQSSVPTRQINDRTPGQRYAALLSACNIGYPLWKPSSRQTDTGNECTINIGDVGICSDEDPFHTLFNITESRSSLIFTSNPLPKGIDPPCCVEGKVTVDPTYHRDGVILVKPGGTLLGHSVSEDIANANQSIFTFDLTKGDGALLMLPRGGTLRKLQQTHAFKGRISRYWREWFEFAEQEGDLDENQTLCLITGLERCSTWAMAAWDSISSESYNNPGSVALRASVDKDSGHCAWTFCPVRCSAQSSALTPQGLSNDQFKETVFIRAFWINRQVGRVSPSPPPLPPPSRDDENESDDDSRARQHQQPSRNPFHHSRSSTYLSRNPFNPFCKGSASGPPSDNDRPQASETRSIATTLSPVGTFIDESNIIHLQVATSEDISHPCRVINRLAFSLLSKVRPALLDSGCIALSHDEDWMDVFKDFGEPDFSETELLRRVCAEYKFVMEGDVIYTEHMSTAELEHIHQGSKLAQNEPNLIPVLLVLRGQEVPLEDVPHLMASELTTTTSRDNDAVMTRMTSRMELLRSSSLCMSNSSRQFSSLRSCSGSSSSLVLSPYRSYRSIDFPKLVNLSSDATTTQSVHRGESFIAGIKTAQLARSQHGGEIFSSGMKAALSLKRTSHNSFAQLPLTSDPPRYKTVNTREEGKTPHAEDLEHIDTVRTSIPLGIHPIVGFLGEAGLAAGGTSVDIDARVVIQELEVIHGSDGAADDVMVKISWHGEAESVTLALESDNTWYERWQMVIEKLPQPPEAYSIPSNSFPPATAPTPPPLEKPLVTKSPVFSTALSLATDKQIHHFRFLVDGEWRIVDNLPTAVDSTGALANYLVVGHGHRRDSPPSAEVIPPVKVYHEPQWTSEIPLELSEAAATETKFIEDYHAQDQSQMRSKSGQRGFLAVPKIPPPQPLPRHLERSILNSSFRRPPPSGGVNPGQIYENQRGKKEGNKTKTTRKKPSTRSHVSSKFSSTETPTGISHQRHHDSGSHSSSSHDFQLPSSQHPSGVGATAAIMPPGFRTNGILNQNLASIADDRSVLAAPSHAVLNHLCVSAIKNGVLAVSQTERYHHKFITTIYYKPT
ncbi:hypothetical protein PM082_004277 [Marasmius tenuissimus]|nr:hypothetical protein PM082_004277 [Marasmius tenuissimus]